MKQTIVDYLVLNQVNIQEHVKDCVNISNAIDYDGVFKDLIEQQKNDLTKRAIINFIASDLALDYETITIVLEDINLGDYLK